MTSAVTSVSGKKTTRWISKTIELEGCQINPARTPDIAPAYLCIHGMALVSAVEHSVAFLQSLIITAVMLKNGGVRDDEIHLLCRVMIPGVAKVGWHIGLPDS